MPYYCADLPELRLTVILPVGHIEETEFVSFFRELAESDRISSESSVVVDTSEQEGGPSMETLQKLTQVGQKARKDNRVPAKIAVIAPGDLSYGLTRMYQAQAATSESNHRVFRDLQAAADWLGLPAESLEEAKARARAS